MIFSNCKLPDIEYLSTNKTSRKMAFMIKKNDLKFIYGYFLFGSMVTYPEIGEWFVKSV